jgi:hypothetical protein
MTKWISVKDRMPEPYDSVLVYSNCHLNKDCCWHVAFYSDGNDEWLIQLDYPENSFKEKNLGAVSISLVTHWMPLPEPPEEKEDERI